MTFESAARRISQCYSGKSFTNRASERVSELVSQLTQLKQLYVDDRELLWRSQHQAEEWSGFRLPPDDGRRLDQIPIIEIEQALILITSVSLSIDHEMLMRETYAVLTPYKKLTQPVRDLLDPIINELIRSHKLNLIEGRIFPAHVFN